MKRMLTLLICSAAALSACDRSKVPGDEFTLNVINEGESDAIEYIAFLSQTDEDGAAVDNSVTGTVEPSTSESNSWNVEAFWVRFPIPDGGWFDCMPDDADDAWVQTCTVNFEDPSLPAAVWCEGSRGRDFACIEDPFE